MPSSANRRKRTGQTSQQHQSCPSLQKEKEEGWDAQLPLTGTAVYYQFKLSERLSRGHARLIKDGTYTTPYYRVSLHRRDGNRQHQRLRVLASQHPNTFYVAPEFDTIEDFNSAFLSRQVATRSRIIPVAECDDINDGDQHYITFQTGESVWRQHSQTKLHRGSFLGAELETIYRSTERQWQKIDREFAESILERAAGIVMEAAQGEVQPVDRSSLDVLNFSPRKADRTEILLRAAEMLSIGIGVTLVLVGSSQQV